MGVVLYITLTVIFIAEFIIGNLGNGFIVLVNCMDWVRRRKISSVDRIVTALAMSRISLLWVGFLDWWTSVLYPALFMTEYTIRMMIYVAWMVTNHFNIWLATSLSIFYFLKIAVFSNSLFLYLKWRVSKVISVLLLVSLVFLFLSMLVTWTQLYILIDGPEKNMSHNSSLRSFSQISMLLFSHELMIMLVPSIMSLVAALLLIFSLWKHHKKIQHNDQGCQDARATTYIRASQTIIAFLLLYISFILSLVAQVYTFELESSVIILFVLVATTIFPSSHSCVLILVNNKFRQVLFFGVARGKVQDQGC